jgi:PAS domain S-box-containing protein
MTATSEFSYMKSTALLSALDIVAFARLKCGSFRLLGSAPDWFRRLYAGSLLPPGHLRLGETFAFLENFLVDAEDLWHQGTDTGQLASGPWCETGADGWQCHLEAVAARLGQRRLLFLQRLGATYAAQHAVLQKARETTLDYHRLQRAEAALRSSEARLADMLQQLKKSHDDLLAILNQLHLGTVMLDEQGRVTFLSHACEAFFGKRQQQVVGQLWEQVSPFSAATQAQLQAMGRRPSQQRTKLSVSLQGSKGQQYWMEVEVQDDPRQRRGKILVFYDMTAVHDLRRLLDTKSQFPDLIGKSEAMLQVYHLIREVARVDTTVLIEGETGTGKELVARAIHFASHRQGGPFIAVNCAGLTESLLASQLFGHKRGAFTGAVADHQGLFAAANGGTLFLDEIGDIPLSVQTNLLRVLQEREITRLGEATPRKIDVRIVAATHQNLQAAVSHGTFRSDLLYRIRVARISLPALRERRSDIPLLVSTFLAHCRAAIGKPVHDVSHSAMRLLLQYHWPGNVRELKSAIEFAVIRCRGTVLKADDLPPELSEPAPLLKTFSAAAVDEPQRIVAALQQAQGNRTLAARLLGMSRATFYRRLVNLDLPVDC